MSHFTHIHIYVHIFMCANVCESPDSQTVNLWRYPSAQTAFACESPDSQLQTSMNLQVHRGVSPLYTNRLCPDLYVNRSLFVYTGLF